MEAPETRYARSGEVSIAYQVFGDGPFDLVLVPPFVQTIEGAWASSKVAASYRSLAEFARVIIFDKRGTGMSDRVVGHSLETRMDDVRAVMDAAGSETAALVGRSEGGPMSILFAATHPERAFALGLWATFARSAWAPDYPFGENLAEWERGMEEDVRSWGSVERMRRRHPNLSDDEVRERARLERMSASPGAVEALYRMNIEIDVRPALGAVQVPAIVMVRSGDHEVIVRGSRYLAEHIPGAELAELPGSAHQQFTEDDAPQIVDRLRTFFTAAWEDAQRHSALPERVLATVLFTDLVGSTEKAVELGPRWQEVLREHNQRIRRELARYSGREVDTAGDGFFASGFDGPARAIRCACAIRDSVGELGLGVRVGVHTGECDLVDGKLAGLAVVVGSRVAAQAQEGEVLVSGTVKDLVAGSGIEFDARGTRELKGLGEWPVYAVATA